MWSSNLCLCDALPGVGRYSRSQSALHAGIVAMLMSATRVDRPPPQPKPIQVLILPLQTAKPSEPPPRERRDRTRRDERERSTAITYPPVPESVFTDRTIARGLGIYRDCAPENLASLSPEERERCGRVVARLPNTNGDTDPTINPGLRAQWNAEVIAKGRIAEGPFHKCVGTRRSHLGLDCWKGLDN